MSLDVIDFTQRKKIYKLEAGEFTLKPPYMYLINQVQSVLDKLTEIVGTEAEDGTKPKLKDGAKDLKKVVDVYFKAMKLILEETANGKLDDLNIDNLGVDAMMDILDDFFSQMPKLKRQLEK